MPLAFFRRLRSREGAELAQENAALAKRLHRIEMQLGEFGEELEALKGHHVKLRNQFHGAKGGRPPGGAAAQGELIDTSDIPRGDKTALRLRLASVPGGLRAHLDK